MRKGVFLALHASVLFSFLFFRPFPAEASSRSLDRDSGPVVVTGDKLPAFDGVPLSQLLVYAYSGGVWRQIPWQFDEVNGGVIVPSEDGNLDHDDELVFMGGDTDDQAPTVAWIADADSQRYARYELTVADPRDSGKKGWVYVYRSATLSNTVTTDYAGYDAGERLFTGQSYRLGMLRGKLGAELLEMNGSGVDILDRTKVRVDAGPFGLFTEDDVSLDPYTVYCDGPVRAIAGVREGSSQVVMVAYRDMFQDIVSLDFSSLGIQFNSARVSADLSPAASGSTYYDANTSGGVTIDGVPDSVATSPVSDWMQASGATGTVVMVFDLDGLSGTLSTWYDDDATIDPQDTGDKMSYGDAGVYMDRPGNKLDIRICFYILPADQPNVGATYSSRAFDPLESQSTAQSYVSARYLYLPVTLRSPSVAGCFVRGR